MSTPPTMPTLDLRHLRYFVAVAETGSLSLAAEKLFIAQPPLSVQIRQLEQALGCALFVRHPKGVRLTPAGLALLPEARGLLDRAARLREVVQGAGRRITVAFVPSASSTVLPVLVRELRQRQADLDLVLHEMISGEQAEALVAGRLDAGIARLSAPHPHLLMRCQMPDPFCLALPADGTVAADGPVDLRRHAVSDFVGFTRHRGPAYFDQSIHLCQQAGFSPRIRHEASTVHGVLDLVGAGLGVALVPASAALLAVDGVVVRPLRASGGAAVPVLALLSRRSDPHPLLPLVEASVEAIFRSIQARIGHLLRP